MLGVIVQEKDVACADQWFISLSSQIKPTQNFGRGYLIGFQKMEIEALRNAGGRKYVHDS